MEKVSLVKVVPCTIAWMRCARRFRRRGSIVPARVCARRLLAPCLLLHPSHLTGRLSLGFGGACGMHPPDLTLHSLAAAAAAGQEEKERRRRRKEAMNGCVSGQEH